MNATETVEIGSSDDEVEAIEQNNPKPQEKTSAAKTDVKKTTETNKKLTITVEDELKEPNLKSTKIVIEIDEVTSNKETETEVPSNIRSIFGVEHDVNDFSPEFMKLLDVCIDFEFSEGMTRILNRNLIPYYKLADKKHTEASEFRKFLENIIVQMKKNPEHKFSYLREVCMNLKSHALRKRAKLITLDKDSETSKKRRLLEVTPKNQIVDVIDLDNEPEAAAVIDVDNEPEDVIFVAEEKENLPIQITSVTSNFVEQPKQKKEDVPIEITSAISNIDPEQEQKQIEERIKGLEAHLQLCKEKIKFYDEMEVTDEDECVTSPYLMSDWFKGELVRVYKELCKLTKSDYKPSAKIGHIKIRITEGHPQGPAQKLQAWLKENREENGDLSFPDFIDIVKCVKAANEEDLLNWSKGQILEEARRLFTECGKALQKRRQKREWRDLVSKVEGAVDEDPADSDPLLWAKLEDNRRIARRKEADILEHYSQLTPGSAGKQRNKITVFKPSAVTTEIAGKKYIEISVDPTQVPTTSTNADFSYEVPIEYDPSCREQNLKTEPIDQKPLLIPQPIDPSDVIVCSDSDDYSTTDDEHSDVEFDDLPVNNNDFNPIPVKVELFEATENDVIAGNDSQRSTGDSEGVMHDTHNSIQKEDNTENKGSRIIENNTGARKNNTETDVLENNIRTSTLDQESDILANDTSANNYNIVNENITDLRYSQVEAVIEHAVATAVLPESADEINTNGEINIQEGVKIKEEPGLSAEETLKLMLEFDNNGLDNVQIKVLDCGEPQICIEISSSSDSESDDDEDNELDKVDQATNPDLQNAEPNIDR
ncbi:hypothetical protein JYU34_001915 [Plutella xylostella]|uniref:Daxx histone-binding domain-containing protein n=1 Tax=Plutella xylostella TaxID=51655 RepID=A0ABQ7R580_PLUXY|nr:hypothetical protein JYU34_001915 [Plutella xylostella]